MHYSLLVICKDSSCPIEEMLDKYSCEPSEENRMFVECEKEFWDSYNSFATFYQDEKTGKIFNYAPSKDCKTILKKNSEIFTVDEFMEENGFYRNCGMIGRDENPCYFDWISVGGRWGNPLYLNDEVKHLEDVVVCERQMFMTTDHFIKPNDFVVRACGAVKEDINFELSMLHKHIYSLYNWFEDEWISSDVEGNGFNDILIKSIRKASKKDYMVVIDCHI